MFKESLLKILDEEEIIEELCLTKWTDPRVLYVPHTHTQVAGDSGGPFHKGVSGVNLTSIFYFHVNCEGFYQTCLFGTFPCDGGPGSGPGVRGPRRPDLWGCALYWL